MNFDEINRQIAAPDEAARARARDVWNHVAKPIGSLGTFELIVEQIAALTGSADVRLDKRCAIVMCADNGVVAEGVSQSGQDITTLICGSIARGTSSVCTMAKTAHIDTFAVDIGMATPSDVPGVVGKSVARGTANMCEGAAMTPSQACQAIQAGIDCARDAARDGYQMIAVGEMGIGNTTTATALACALLGLSVEDATGKGAGLTDAGLARKRDAIARALNVNAPRPGTYRDDIFRTLCALGGFDVCGMVGLYLGGALARVPIVVDGYISSVAALIAAALCPASKQAMIASHVSAEPAARAVLDELGLSPILFANMHLGEGTGAICLIPLLDMALSLYRGTTFAQTGMDAYEVNPQ